jgi:uncharacterized protein (DUF2267 family)
MSRTGLAVFDTTLQETNGWLRAIMEEQGWDDRQRAYEALRGTLQALRDYLTVDEAAQLAAQLPMLVRGIYYEGWDPSRVPVEGRGREDFLRRVAAAFGPGNPRVDPEPAARTVLRVVAGRVSAGEVEDVRGMLPREVRVLWPAA